MVLMPLRAFFDSDPGDRDYYHGSRLYVLMPLRAFFDSDTTPRDAVVFALM